MGTVGWLLVVAIGIALGFSVGRLWPGSTAKVAELERERDAARTELKTYRQDVSAHFEATAELFDKVTADYRGLYEHLAVGARQLGAIRGEPVELPLAEPEMRRLAPLEPASDDTPAEEAPREPPPLDSEAFDAREADAEVDDEDELAASEAAHAPELQEKDRNSVERAP